MSSVPKGRILSWIRIVLVVVWYVSPSNVCMACIRLRWGLCICIRDLLGYMQGRERETVGHSTRSEHVEVAERDMQYAVWT